MSNDRLRRAEEIFFAVERLPDGARGAAAHDRCGGDAALLAEVQSLLAHASVPDAFLGSPPLGAGLLSTPPRAPLAGDDHLEGKIVGAFRLVRRVASGGMGTVYEAVRADGAFEQRVAVKVVKRGMDTDEIVGSFRRERQTLAGLSHPNIARLLDGGVTPDGRPFLAMEFVDGQPIDEYCDAHRLPTADRLRLFCKVCDAVHAAHQHLVVHRDLKPGNILVDLHSEPRLLDFGIAKVLEPGATPAATVPEQRRLTPEYASPEQVGGVDDGVITTASDVYSLGVILYELLSGRRPYTFASRTTAEFEWVVCHEQPLPPSQAASQLLVTPPNSTAGGATPSTRPNPALARSTSPERLRRRLRGDLDNCVLMAMRKDPHRRYSSAGQFGDDIRRYLDGLPVIARRDTLAYRTAKFVRLHALGVSAAAAIVLSLALGAAGIAWQARNALLQRDAAFLARDQAEATTEFITDMLASADPETNQGEVTVRQLLESLAVRIGTDFEPKPLVKASLMASMGASFVGLGDYDRAERFLTESLALRRSLLGDGHHDVAEGMVALARLRYATNRLDEAEDLLRRSLDTFQKIRGPENADTARVMNDLGAVLRAAGKTDEAERTHREALRIRRLVNGNDSLAVAESLNNLAGVLRQKGDPAGAEQAAAETLRIRRRLLPPTHVLVAQSVANLGVMKTAVGDLVAAESLLREALALEAASIGTDHPAHAQTLSSLGSLLRVTGRPAQACPYLEQALRIRRDRLPAGDLRTLATELTLAHCLEESGSKAECLGILEALIPALEAAGPIAQTRLDEARELRRAAGSLDEMNR